MLPVHKLTTSGTLFKDFLKKIFRDFFSYRNHKYFYLLFSWSILYYLKATPIFDVFFAMCLSSLIFVRRNLFYLNNGFDLSQLIRRDPMISSTCNCLNNRSFAPFLKTLSHDFGHNPSFHIRQFFHLIPNPCPLTQLKLAELPSVLKTKLAFIFHYFQDSPYLFTSKISLRRLLVSHIIMYTDWKSWKYFWQNPYLFTLWFCTALIPCYIMWCKLFDIYYLVLFIKTTGHVVLLTFWYHISAQCDKLQS